MNVIPPKAKVHHIWSCLWNLNTMQMANKTHSFNSFWFRISCNCDLTSTLGNWIAQQGMNSPYSSFLKVPTSLQYMHLFVHRGVSRCIQKNLWLHIIHFIFTASVRLLFILYFLFPKSLKVLFISRSFQIIKCFQVIWKSWWYFLVLMPFTVWI